MTVNIVHIITCAVQWSLKGEFLVINIYILENKSFEKKWMRVQHKKLENEQQRTYKEVRGGKLYEKEHKVAKQ